MTVATHQTLRRGQDITDQVAEKIRTPITDLFKIQHPIMLAGMNVAAGPKLAAAVTNAGGLGVIGGVGYTPDMLREQISELKEHLADQKAPFGVDLLLPQVGGNARKTKYVPYFLTKRDLFLFIECSPKSHACLRHPRNCHHYWILR